MGLRQINLFFIQKAEEGCFELAIVGILQISEKSVASGIWGKLTSNERRLKLRGLCPQSPTFRKIAEMSHNLLQSETWIERVETKLFRNFIYS